MLTRGEEIPMDITEVEDVELIVLDEERTAEGVEVIAKGKEMIAKDDIVATMKKV
jgi:hypothetical protein